MRVGYDGKLEVSSQSLSQVAEREGCHSPAQEMPCSPLDQETEARWVKEPVQNLTASELLGRHLGMTQVHGHSLTCQPALPGEGGDTGQWAWPLSAKHAQGSPRLSAGLHPGPSSNVGTANAHQG